MKEMNIFEREVGGRRYRIASQSVWDPGRQRPFARQVVLGPADPPPVADLSLVRTIGTQRVGDAGALVWVAEQLDLIGLIDRACGQKGPEDGPTIGEMIVAVAVQRACAPGAKCQLAALVSETGHVPLLHRTYPGNGSDQAVLGSCLDALGKLHDVLDHAEQRIRPCLPHLGAGWRFVERATGT